MTTTNFKIGQTVNYTNGQPEIYTGKIVQIQHDTLVIIDNEAGMKLWEMGYSVGACISFSQVV